MDDPTLQMTRAEAERGRLHGEIEAAERRIKIATDECKDALIQAFKRLERAYLAELMNFPARHEVGFMNNFTFDEMMYLDDKASDVAGAIYRSVQEQLR